MPPPHPALRDRESGSNLIVGNFYPKHQFWEDAPKPSGGSPFHTALRTRGGCREQVVSPRRVCHNICTDAVLTSTTQWRRRFVFRATHFALHSPPQKIQINAKYRKNRSRAKNTSARACILPKSLCPVTIFYQPIHLVLETGITPHAQRRCREIVMERMVRAFFPKRRQSAHPNSSTFNSPLSTEGVFRENGKNVRERERKRSVSIESVLMALTIDVWRVWLIFKPVTLVSTFRKAGM